MKKFAGNKPLAVIRRQCKRLGLTVRDQLWKQGSDFITIEGGGASVVYSTFNGRFFGTTDTGVAFNSDSTVHEAETWFQALLSFFFIEQPALAGAAHINA